MSADRLALLLLSLGPHGVFAGAAGEGGLNVTYGVSAGSATVVSGPTSLQFVISGAAISIMGNGKELANLTVRR